MDIHVYRIALTTGKGGVGKTTSALNMSTIAADHDMVTVFIDSDPSKNATNHLLYGIEDQANLLTIKDLYTFLIENDIDDVPDEDLLAFLIPTKYENLFVLPGDKGMAKYAEELILLEYKRNIDANVLLYKYVKRIEKYFDIMFFDNPPTYGNIITRNTIIASNMIISPISGDGYSLEGLEDTIDSVQSMIDKYKYEIQFRGFFLTNVVENLSLNKLFYDQYQNDLGNNFLNTWIRREQKTTMTTVQKNRLIDYSPDGRALLDYKKLFIELGILPDKIEKKIIVEIRRTEKIIEADLKKRRTGGK